MRKIILAVIVLTLVLAGCNKKPFEPVVSATVEELNLHENLDPLTLVKDVENVGLTFEVINNTIDYETPGEYTITYKVSLKKQSVERTFTFVIKDSDPPVITCPDTIDILYGNAFVLKEHASAIDGADGDVTSSMHFEGSINNYKVGTYQITLVAVDKYNNESTKEVTINIKKDKNETYKDSVCGSYKDISCPDTVITPTLVLNSDSTFVLFMSRSGGGTTVEGKYLQYNDVLYLVPDDASIFSTTTEQNLVRFVVEIDGNLRFDSTDSATNSYPSYCDIFERTN